VFAQFKAKFGSNKLEVVVLFNATANTAVDKQAWANKIQDIVSRGFDLLSQQSNFDSNFKIFKFLSNFEQILAQKCSNYKLIFNFFSVIPVDTLKFSPQN
jgi:hypothetical protein